MTRKLMEVSIAIFMVVCTIALLVGFFSFKPVLNSGSLILEDSHQLSRETQTLLKELTQRVAETPKITAELTELMKQSSIMVIKTAEFFDEAKQAPRELGEALKTVQLAVDDVKMALLETQKYQMELAQAATNTTDVMYEFGIAVAAVALSEKNIISSDEADQMISQSVNNIESHSDRLGKLIRALNEYRSRARPK